MARWVGTGIIRNWFAQNRTCGAVVPFEDPALRMARACDDEHDGLIAVLRDFANNGTAYIVPWASLPLMVTMTDRDLALHEAVGARKASTPAQVRAVISDLALSGALGTDAKVRESERIGVEQSRRADVELVLILHLMDRCGAVLTTLLADPTHWRDVHATSAVTATVAAMGIGRQIIAKRIAEFATVLTPVGLVAADEMLHPGWLRVLHNEIDGFSRSIDVPLQSPDARVHLTAIAESAQTVAQLSGAVISAIDYAVLDIGGTIRRWDAELPVITQAIDRLSFLLDEWPSLIKSVHDVLRGPPDEMAKQLRTVRTILPRLPEADSLHGDCTLDGDSKSLSISCALSARLATIWSFIRSSRSINH
jgi:hypothetical protein